MLVLKRFVEIRATEKVLEKSTDVIEATLQWQCRKVGKKLLTKGTGKIGSFNAFLLSEFGIKMVYWTGMESLWDYFVVVLKEVKHNLVISISSIEVVRHLGMHLFLIFWSHLFMRIAVHCRQNNSSKYYLPTPLHFGSNWKSYSFTAFRCYKH